MSNTEDPTIQPAASGQDASQHSSPLREPQPQTAPSSRKRPGRKPKSAKAPGEQDLRWTNEMIETLLKLRRVKYLSYFMSKSNPKAAGEGWSLVVKDWCQHHNRIEPLTKIRSKYDNLLKKWRDFGPGSGKQTKRTGNNQPEPNTLDDPLPALILLFLPNLLELDRILANRLTNRQLWMTTMRMTGCWTKQLTKFYQNRHL